MPPSPSTQNGVPQPASITTGPSHNNPSKQDAEDLTAINSTIDRMRAFTPQDPYVLTIPQDEPRYHHQYAFQARQWLDHTPFDYREHESTQYQTFRYYEPGKEMFMLHSSRPAAEGAVAGSVGLVNAEAAAVVRGRERAVTGANTPAMGDSGGGAGAGPKKTMSLNAYKKKQGGQVTPVVQKTSLPAAARKEADVPSVAEVKVKKAAVKGPVERLKADEEMLAAVEEEEDVDGGLITSAEPPHEMIEEKAKKELKRKREDVVLKKDDGTEEQNHRTQENRHAEDEERAVKKVKRNATPPKAERKKDSPTDSQPADRANKSKAKPSSSTPKRDEEENENENVTALPPRLSPLSDLPPLPPRLSPTLPANIAAALKAREHFRSTSRSSDIRARSLSKDSGSRLTPPPSRNLDAGGAGGTVKRKSPVPKNAFRANSSSPAVRSDAEETRGRPMTSVPRRVRSPVERVVEVESQDEEIAVGRVAMAKKVAEMVDREESRARSLVVRLKFRKVQREDVRKILKGRPEPGRGGVGVEETVRVEKPSVVKTADQRRRERRDTNAKGVAHKIGPATASTTTTTTTTTTTSNSVAMKSKKKAKENTAASPEKRSRPVEESDDSTIGPPAKRKKENPAEQPPRTPIPKSDHVFSPSANSTNTQKAASTSTPTATGTATNTVATPNNNSLKKGRELLSAAVMKRELSTDSHVFTPSAASTTGGAGGSQSSPSVVSRPTPDPSSTTASSHQQQQQQANGIPKSQPTTTRTPTQQAWESAQKRLDALGRELKHAASAHLTALKKTDNPHASSSSEQQQQRELAAVKSLESLLAYMLAFTSADEAAAAAEPKSNSSPRPWRSLHGFFGFVKRNCEPFPLLLGIACWLGVVFNARILEIGTLHPVENSGSGSRDAMLETQAMLLRAAHEAEGRLDVDALLAFFPRTWEGRQRGGGGAAAAAAAETEKLEPGVFEGSYKLPLGVQSSPVRAVRAGYALLGEWIGRQKEGGSGGGEKEMYVLKLKLNG